jgi:hypothetical protein
VLRNRVGRHRELFVTLPGVHSARWMDRWNAPKIGAFVILAAAITTMAAALLLVAALRKPSARRLARAIELSALATIAAGWIWMVIDFVEGAGHFG